MLPLQGHNMTKGEKKKPNVDDKRKRMQARPPRREALLPLLGHSEGANPKERERGSDKVKSISRLEFMNVEASTAIKDQRWICKFHS